MNSFQKTLVDRGLTERQAMVTESALSGKTNNEIAEQLKIKVPTVKFHMYNIFKTLKIKTRLGLSHELGLQYLEHKKSLEQNLATE